MVVFKFNRKEVSIHLKTFSSGHNNLIFLVGMVTLRAKKILWCVSFGEKDK